MRTELTTELSTFSLEVFVCPQCRPCIRHHVQDKRGVLTPFPAPKTFLPSQDGVPVAGLGSGLI